MSMWDKFSADGEAGLTHSTTGGQAGQSTMSRNSSMMEEERELLLKRQELPGWRVDRGAGFYQEERIRHNRASLVETGRHAGRSRVKREGIQWTVMLKHILKRDFFNAAVNAKLLNILATLCVLYTATIVWWAFLYWVTWRLDETCFIGFSGPVSALLFSVETQQTIGYGTRSPNDCWAAAFLIAVHSLVTVVLDSIILGIAFSRISHPKNRGRTILISDSAVISRRDGILKLMFRVADIQKSQVVAPHVHCYLYTWGDGRRDRSLLLPITVEHTIDENSPLHGMTQKMLETVGAELVVEFAGSTELGDMFQVRQSYLASELHWGYCFATIITRAPPGETQHTVDLSRFHDIEPQPGLEALPPHKLSAKIVASPGIRTVPAPLLHDNTLVVSEEAVVGSRDGRLFLMFRVGDTYPGGQVDDVRVEALMYRWMSRVTSEGETLPYKVEELHLHPRVMSLRYPMVLTHEICDTSPIAHWSTRAGKRQDADCEIVVTVKGILTSACPQRLVSRTRYFQVSSIRWGATFVPMLTRQPTPGEAHIDWPAFHLIVPMELSVAPPTLAAGIREGPMSRSNSFVNLQVHASGQGLPPLLGSTSPSAHADGRPLGEPRSRLEKSSGAAATHNAHGAHLPPPHPPHHPHTSPSAVVAAAAAAVAAQAAAAAAASHPAPTVAAVTPAPAAVVTPVRPKAVQAPSGHVQAPSGQFNRTSSTAGSSGASAAGKSVAGASSQGGAGGDDWRDTRSLFAAINAMNELFEEEQEQEHMDAATQQQQQQQ